MIDILKQHQWEHVVASNEIKEDVFSTLLDLDNESHQKHLEKGYVISSIQTDGVVAAIMYEHRTEKIIKVTHFSKAKVKADNEELAKL